MYSDDTSMAHCLADSLLANNFELNQKDLMYRFFLWWCLGYNNGSYEFCQQSFGLGENIEQSFNNFYKNEKNYKYTEFGINNGNGSIMRLAPIPISFYNDEKKAMELAAQQSMVTHNGNEAYECSRLLAQIICQLINYNGSNPKQDVLDKLSDNFQITHHNNQSVWYLAQSLAEPNQNYQQYPRKFNTDDLDRNWDWKSKDLTLSPTRLQHSDYYGSYVMDCMKIALHIVYNSDNLIDCLFKTVSIGGDSDTIGAVVGQIAGAMYGLNKELIDLYCDKMVNFEQYSTIVKAYKLFHKTPVNTSFKLLSF